MIQDPKPFEDIAPYPDSMFHEKMQHLVKEPGFEHAVKWVLPQVDFKELCDNLLQVQDKDTFQHKIMWPFLEMLADKTTSGSILYMFFRYLLNKHLLRCAVAHLNNVDALLRSRELLAVE